MPICTKCRADKPESEFYANRGKINGLTSWCGKCVSAQIVERLSKDPILRESILRRSRMYRDRNLELFRNRSQKFRQKLRRQVIERLGAKCANPYCLWINQDLTLGCKEFFCLQVDHVKADGLKDRMRFTHRTGFYRAILKNPDGYQLLCANCNWLKRYANEEYGAAKINKKIAA